MTAVCVSNLRALAAIFRRDWTVFTSYRTRLISHVLSSVSMIFMFRFTSRLVHVSMFRTSDEYFGFAVVGVVTLQVLTSTLTTPPASVRQELVAGTFERLVLSPFGPVMSTMSMMLFPLIYTIATATVTLAIAVIGFGLPLHWATVPLALPAAVLGALSFMPFGIAIAAATLAVKQAQIATTYVIAAIGLFAGFYFPVSLLPGWIQWTSKVQPFTPSVDLIRHLLLGSPLPAPAWLEVVKLAGFAIVLIPASAMLLAAAVQLGRRRGTITEY
jgi:ABC-2 type transport system permease protein